jgi:hypothetical protein
MGILYQTDEQGKRLAVVIPIAEWEALQARLRGEARLSPQDEQDRREAHDALAQETRWTSAKPQLTGRLHFQGLGAA